ncbi:MAG: hypothetical protein AAF755_09670 [Pseudomonadota bacterium]
MTDIEELQRRITSAIERVAVAVERVESDTGSEGELAQALQDERTANAQLNERIRALKAKSDEETAQFTAEVEKAQARIADLDLALQRVRQANSQLTEACAALIEANQEGVGEPHLINKAMAAELEGLRAARSAEAAEASAIIAALSPLVDQKSAPEQSDPQEDG